MKIVSTFVPNLYAFHFPHEEFDELERVFDNWKNQLFLFEFFTDNEVDLKRLFTVEKAVVKTNEEVKKFRKKMLALAQENPHQLNEFFANLNNKEYQLSLLQRQKAKQNWLRLYALKITQEDKEDLYIITGGMIKLTLNMEDRTHGERERNKINQCRDYLKTIGVYDLESFFEICF